jgi:hypothetical protein
MTEEQFWEIVESTKADAGSSFDGHFKELVARLTTLEPEEIAAFDLNFDILSIRAYSWDLWGAAYVIHGGCSDDNFTDFRSWLISMGRNAYERALADPESLADIELGPDGEEDVFFEVFGYVAATAYRAKMGKEMSLVVTPYPSDPSGEPFEEDSDDLARRYPRLFSRYGNE